MNEYRITISITQHGRPSVAEGNAEALLEGFGLTAPQSGAVVGADFEEETLDATFCVEADDVDTAIDKGVETFISAARQTDLKPVPFREIEVAILLPKRHGLRQRLRPQREWTNSAVHA